MYELSVAGLIALLFGLASYYGLGEMGIFSQINLALGGLALLAAMASGFRRLGSVGGPHSRPVIARGLALIAAAIALGVLAERMADRSDIHFDLTFEHAFEVSPAVRDTLAALPVPAEALLFADGADRRIRRTRLLLEALAANGNLNVRVVDLYEHPELAERYELEPDAAASNTVVLVLNNDWVPNGGLENFGSSFLPASHQATMVRAKGVPVDNIVPSDSKKIQRRKLAILAQQDAAFARRTSNPPAIENRCSPPRSFSVGPSPPCCWAAGRRTPCSSSPSPSSPLR